MYFALFVGRRGKVVVIEPDPESVAALRAIARERDLPQLEVVESGAWSEAGELTLHVDPAHPATNFTENTAGYTEEEMARFEKITMKVDTVDGVLGRLGISGPRIVSITTNGAEAEIVEGMKETIAAGLPFAAMARTSPDNEALMDSVGFRRIAFDDRGYTFARKA